MHHAVDQGPVSQFVSPANLHEQERSLTHAFHTSRHHKLGILQTDSLIRQHHRLETRSAQQIEARRFAELLIRVYEAGLMLEEAQYLIDQENDWRKAVMAMKYISDKFPRSTQPITGQMLSVKYFDSIFYMEKVETLHL